MNKKLAKDKSTSSTLSIGELREMISRARSRGGMSKVNPHFTVDETCDIFERALAGRSDDEVPAGMREDFYRRRAVPTRDSFMIYNILRDCA